MAGEREGARRRRGRRVTLGAVVACALFQLSVGCVAKETLAEDATRSPETTFASCDACRPWQDCPGGACTCTPTCDQPCLDDGCGGTCACPAGYLPNGAGVWVPGDECHDTCASAGARCGSVCGEDCGLCGPRSTCAHGSCECEPTCDGTRCDDGCGGDCPCAAGTACNRARDCVPAAQCTEVCGGASCGEVCGSPCGTCAEGASCLGGVCTDARSCTGPGCPLTLRLVGKRVSDGRLREVTLAVDYAPGTNAHPGDLARIAAVWIRANRPVWLARAEATDSARTALKELHDFGTPGRGGRRRPEGLVELLLHGRTGARALPAGQLLTVTLRMDEYGPLRFSLSRRQQTLAPMAADALLQASSYEGEVVVTR